MNKALIQSRFAKHLKDYNENAKIQKLMAERLSSLIKKNHYDNVLEIGCGTGFLTKLISEKISFKNYTAIDIVEDCRNYIEEINPKINFINADVENFVKENFNKPDLIVSNAALQWIEDFPLVVNNLKTSLNNDGEFFFSTFGKENFREIFYILGTSLNYYSKEELVELFPSATIYPPEVHIMSFKTPLDVLKHLKLTGVNGIYDTKWTKKDLREFESAYSNLCGSRPTLTYNPLYVYIDKSYL